VDDLLDRLALEIAERDALIAELAQGATVSQRQLESTASARAAEQSILPTTPPSPPSPAPPGLPSSTSEDGQSAQSQDKR
jgi:hypothetical protein